MAKDTDFSKNVLDEIQALIRLYKYKSSHYSDKADQLANFRTAAKLGTLPKEACGDEYSAMYEVAKQFMAKHVSHVYNNFITGDNVMESLCDIALYCMIMRAMIQARKSEMPEADCPRAPWVRQ